jgi:hypothetical protein
MHLHAFLGQQNLVVITSQAAETAQLWLAPTGMRRTCACASTGQLVWSSEPTNTTVHAYTLQPHHNECVHEATVPLTRL